jgi:alpha-D-ribose 1-methylphosphonate 5-triphosphate diphosphatase
MGLSGAEEEKDRILRERMNRAKLTRQQMKDAADLAVHAGIPIASHDDDSLEKLDYVTRELHATISEFPVELGIAKAARDRDMLVVVGAPNILMGRSHSNNLSATTAVQEGCADIMVSDYFPPAILHAVFKLYMDGLMPLYQAVNMASYNPARAMHISNTLGSIEEGKWGDLMLVAMRGAIPAVTDVFIGGQHVSSLRYCNDLLYGAGECHAG